MTNADRKLKVRITRPGEERIEAKAVVRAHDHTWPDAAMSIQAVGSYGGQKLIGGAVELRTSVIVLAAFLIVAVVLTVLGFGGAAGNASGLLFWFLLAVLAIAFSFGRLRSTDEDVVSLTQRSRKREPR